MTYRNIITISNQSNRWICQAQFSLGVLMPELGLSLQYVVVEKGKAPKLFSSYEKACVALCEMIGSEQLGNSKETLAKLGGTIEGRRS